MGTAIPIYWVLRYHVGKSESSVWCTEAMYVPPLHDCIIKWKHFLHEWPFVRGIHRSLVNSPHKGQRHRALMFSLICIGINDWVNNRETGDLRCDRAHYDVIIILEVYSSTSNVHCKQYMHIGLLLYILYQENNDIELPTEFGLILIFIH